MGNKPSGQALIEFTLGLLLLSAPLILGSVGWFTTEWNKIKCAHETFQRARTELINTHQRVELERSCGPIKLRIELLSLEDLDQNKGALGITDGIKEATHLWEAALRLHSSL